MVWFNHFERNQKTILNRHSKVVRSNDKNRNLSQESHSPWVELIKKANSNAPSKSASSFQW